MHKYDVFSFCFGQKCVPFVNSLITELKLMDEYPFSVDEYLVDGTWRGRNVDFSKNFMVNVTSRQVLDVCKTKKTLLAITYECFVLTLEIRYF